MPKAGAPCPEIGDMGSFGWLRVPAFQLHGVRDGGATLWAVRPRSAFVSALLGEAAASFRAASR